MPVHFPQVPLSFNDLGRRKNQVPCNFFQVPDSFARRQDLKKEEAALCIRLPPLLWQIYYIFRRNPNAVFPILTFTKRRAAAGRIIGDAGRAYTDAGRANTAAGKANTDAGRATTAAGKANTDAGRAITAAGIANTDAGRATKHSKNATRHLRSALPAFRKSGQDSMKTFPSSRLATLAERENTCH